MRSGRHYSLARGCTDTQAGIKKFAARITPAARCINIAEFIAAADQPDEEVTNPAAMLNLRGGAADFERIVYNKRATAITNLVKWPSRSEHSALIGACIMRRRCEMISDV